jgi:hypothetical protein
MPYLLLVLPLLFAAALLPARADTPFAGRWAEDADACRNTRVRGDEKPVMITRWSIETTTAFCRVLAAARTTGRTWRLRAHCGDNDAAAGEPRRPLTVTLRLERDRLTLQKDSTTRLLVRCWP